uniref:Immunoglobulin V-set domain-containing protein n=1 Tax=Astyanax mexicanus TaxID=7994 RepID=A0A3B1JQU0_ASTMX
CSWAPPTVVECNKCFRQISFSFSFLAFTDIFGLFPTVTISYKYDKANYLFWYRQYPGSRPEYLVRIFPKEGATSDPNPLFPQFSSTVDFSESRVNLIISSTAVSDSALYYCALRPTVTETHQTLY